MNDWKTFSLHTELNNKDKYYFPKNINDLYKVYFFKKKKSSLFFFKSENKYKANIDFKINIKNLKKNIENKNIPQKENLIKFFNFYSDKIKINNTNEVNNKIKSYINNNFENQININQKLITYNKNHIDLGNNILLNLEKNILTLNERPKKFISYGKIIINELFLNNINLIQKLITEEITNNLKMINKNLALCRILLIINYNRLEFWKNEFIENGLNFIILDSTNIDKEKFNKYDIVISFFSDIENENKKINSNFLNNNYWNNYIIEFDSLFLKNKSYHYLNFIKYKKKFIILNKYYLIDDYTTVLNLFNKNYENLIIDTNSILNFIEFNRANINKKININKNYISFSPNEKIRYNDYIEKFKNFYSKNNILFEDDIFLRKLCCYPNKNLKINILNYKNISDDINLLEIKGEYKIKIIKSIKKKKKNQCNICLGNINPNNFGITKCGHFFCYNCIYKSIDLKDECPICRHKLTMDDIFYIKYSSKTYLKTNSINNLIIKDLGSKIESLILLISKLGKAVIVSNFIECLNLIKKNFEQLDISTSDIMFLTYDLNNWDYQKKIKDIDNIIFLDPLYEKNIDIISTKYKYIFNLFSKKEINLHNLIIKNSIEEEIFKKNYEKLKTIFN